MFLSTIGELPLACQKRSAGDLLRPVREITKKKSIDTTSTPLLELAIVSMETIGFETSPEDHVDGTRSR
jgi:hypothetical protein